MNRVSRWIPWCVLLVPALAASQAEAPDGAAVTVGSKAFTESVILGEMMTGLL